MFDVSRSPNPALVDNKGASDSSKTTVHINPCALITDFVTEKKPKDFSFPASKKKDKDEPIEVIRWSEVNAVCMFQMVLLLIIKLHRLLPGKSLSQTRLLPASRNVLVPSPRVSA
eukprot:753925-Hanusia_phi.AAC.8